MTARGSIRLAAALTAVAGAATAGAAPTGTRGRVDGAAEAPLVEAILNCMSLEEDVVSQMQALAPNGKPDLATRTDAVQALETAKDCLGAAMRAVRDAKNDPTGWLAMVPRFESAGSDLFRALEKDVDAVRAIQALSDAGKILAPLQEAEDLKQRALRNVQGLDTSAHEAELYGSRRVVPYSPQDGYGLSFDGKHDKAFVRSTFHGQNSLVSVAIDPTGAETKAAAKKKPADRYVAFRAKKGKTGGEAALEMRREAKGPFEAVVSAGFFNLSSKAALAALGKTTACSSLRFDVKDAATPEFLSLCAEPGNGTVRVYAANASGEIASTTVIHANRVVLHVVYDGTTFRCEWKSEGSSDGSYAQVATWTRAQGTDSWTVSLGGAHLEGAADVGVDDFAMWAIYVF